MGGEGGAPGARRRTLRPLLPGRRYCCGALCSLTLARKRVLSILPWKMGTPISMHFSMTSRRSIPDSRASSVGVRWIAIAMCLL